MLLAICTTQVKKRVKRKRKKEKVTKNVLQGNTNPDPPNTLELKTNASIHWITSESAKTKRLKEVYIPSLW